MGGARGATAVWSVAALAYLVAVVHRTALGVAGADAIDRFALGATGLATFSVMQLVVYAGLQIPAGRLLDRFGVRALVAAGSAVMAAGQGLLAVADDVPTALVARALIGGGDAAIFISACRLIAQHFPARRVPVMVQVTGLVGQAGQIVSAAVVLPLLHARGWGATFGALAAVGAAVAVAAAVGLGAPPVSSTPAAARERFVPAVRAAALPAGIRLGFWAHFTAPFSANVVAMLWGTPFLLSAQGRTLQEVSVVLTGMTLAGMTSGPLVGQWTARHPLRRSWVVLGSAAATLAAWVWLLAPSTPRPFSQLVVVAVVLGAGAPVSLVGIDYARTFSPIERLGTATGFVNMGGFTSTVVGVLLVGVVLELVSPPGTTTYSLDAYRAAFAALLLPWALGVAGVLHSRRRTRAALTEAGTPVPPLREAVRRRRAA
ncbi:major facilitator superfamily MFS_1 [Cellulomonas flavigena DSM 20109]|uniref:Major facilitator superfamily MFS_1 n=1 Tax=Cellulomonas flavigena (strain ATCC 482 / DSM 20109 / BCRC 11376 / JCM 18109 / NBRC 3775 / NCIMB 8073 / NRS 134) TaxID=446466 RepID=D5UJZ7_CELFN|nr:MFS transporter [Cellulomonas flavigena]ADG73739.1 major facilitator superfamily MFS_1 [Cellulomonas flavigena DSM 20109]